MGKAKIVCTIGPASASRKIIREMLKSGMNVARLNFSHGDHEGQGRVCAYVREEAAKLKKTVAVLQDLQGIKIRIGDVAGGGIQLVNNREVSLRPGSLTSDEKNIYITYPALLQDVKSGDFILIDDGLLKLKVTGRTRDALRAVVVEGGLLRSRKGVNLPSSRTTLAAFTDKDRKDLAFGLIIGVDYVAVSFVRTAADIERVLHWAKRGNRKLPPIIAKIEKPEALRNIDEIIEIVDGIMVARGDLGVEMPTESVPVLQKSLIDLANRKGKLVITATQMLESMTQHSRPTRAEASDVANAVLDGTDALMLSAETTTGKFPVETVKMMQRIIESTESASVRKLYAAYEPGCSFAEATADGACKAAQDIGARAIVVLTHSGFTAKLISKLRPSVPVVAFAPKADVCRRMAIYWGVTPLLLGKWDDGILDAKFMAQIERVLLNNGLAGKGHNIVLAASSPFLGKPNIIRLHRI